jgi:cellulose synthase/poly-beta-1,6-N-acetylglucosamine synthase-like glycosyltransferase
MRPPVDVVVPFVGSDEALRSLCHTLEELDLSEADSVTVVDNRPQGTETETAYGRVRVVRAPAIQSSYYARNCGARAGAAPWLLFVDADVRLSRDLLERYFDEPPADKTGVLAGAIGNEEVASGGSRTVVARYSALKGLFAQQRTLDRGELGYAMTANCAIRRSAFVEVGGFIETIRSGGDADICFRIRAKGWGMEARDRAVVTHVNRETLSQLVRQSMRHGSGAAWLETMYPRFSQAGEMPGRTSRTSRRLVRAGVEMTKGNLDELLVVTIDVVRRLAFQAGRHISNEATTSSSRR